jgi:hypothetical protein
MARTQKAPVMPVQRDRMSGEVTLDCGCVFPTLSGWVGSAGRACSAEHSVLSWRIDRSARLIMGN